MAILFFLSQELCDKYPKLKNQVHAGWIKAFRQPISMDQLLVRPEAIDMIMFQESGEKWFLNTMQTLVVSLDKTQMEDRGITEMHITKLEDASNSEPSQVHINS